MKTNPASTAFVPGWGKRLAVARRAIKQTQAGLGESLGVRNTAVSKWEQEATEGIDARSLTALEYLHGIRQAWLVSGEEPITVSTWNREVLRDQIDTLAAARVDGVWSVPAHSGMAPLLAAGELVFWSAAEEPAQGALLLVAPASAAVSTPGIPPEGTRIGQAFHSGEEWLIYRPEDRESPGTFPAIPMKGLRVIGRVVARAAALDPIEQALKA